MTRWISDVPLWLITLVVAVIANLLLEGPPDDAEGE